METTVKGSDLKVGQVFKLGGRWVRLARWEDPEWSANGFRFARVAPARTDPRMALLYDTVSRMRTQKFILAGDEYPTREQEAPVYTWVTRLIERQEA